MEVETVSSFLDAMYSVSLTAYAEYRQPESFQESLDCAEHKE